MTALFHLHSEIQKSLPITYPKTFFYAYGVSEIDFIGTHNMNRNESGIFMKFLVCGIFGGELLLLF